MASKILLSERERLIIRAALNTEFLIMSEQLKTASKNDQVTISNHLADIKSLVNYIKIN